MLRRVLADRTAVIVTHDVLDALLLADRVVVIDGGRVVEDGPTAEVLARPRSAFAARIAGLNLVRGTLEGHGVRGRDGLLVEGLAEEPVGEGDGARRGVPPQRGAVYREPPGGSPRNVIAVTITELEPHGDQIRVRTADLSADVTRPPSPSSTWPRRRRVVFAVKASEVAIYRA